MNESLYRPVRLGGLTLPGNLFAAPMAGYTDAVCRALALEGGADLAFTEMTSAAALLRGSERTLGMMRRAAGEAVLAVQLFGSDPEILGEAAHAAREAGADLLDLNAGCPVPKVTAKGSGAALARDPRRLAAAVEAMAAAGLPTTVKLRSGWDGNSLNWESAAEAVVGAGAAALGFHPRTRDQGYAGRADHGITTALVRTCPVPVIASGDVDGPVGAATVLRDTGCAAVMVARGGIGDPGIYHRIRDFLETGREPPEPGRLPRLEAALRHLRRFAEAFGEDLAGREMKKHLAGYVKGWESSAEFRRRLMRAPAYTDLEALLKDALERG